MCFRFEYDNIIVYPDYTMYIQSSLHSRETTQMHIDKLNIQLPRINLVIVSLCL